MTATFSTLRQLEQIEVEVVPVDADGNPTAATFSACQAASQIPNASIVAPSITPATSGCMILLIGHTADDGTAGAFSGAGPPVERLDDNTNLGDDAGIFADSFVQAVAAATTARTSTYSASVMHLASALAISPNGTPAFIATGTVAKVASGNFTPGEPAGAASGHVLIMVIEQRDNVAATLSSDWTKVYSIDHSKSTSDLARASVYWCRRGGSAPSYLVTRAAGSTGIAAVMAFSNCKTTGNPIERVAASQCIVRDGVIGDSTQPFAFSGQFPGTDTIQYNATDPFSVDLEDTQAVTVLDASTIRFSASPLLFLFPVGGGGDYEQFVSARGGDTRTDEPISRELYAISDVVWTIQSATNDVIELPSGLTGSGQTVNVVAIAGGEDAIVVTARNVRGTTITATLTVRVLAAEAAPITISEG